MDRPRWLNRYLFDRIEHRMEQNHHYLCNRQLCLVWPGQRIWPTYHNRIVLAKNNQTGSPCWLISWWHHRSNLAIPEYRHASSGTRVLLEYVSHSARIIFHATLLKIASKSTPPEGLSDYSIKNAPIDRLGILL